MGTHATPDSFSVFLVCGAPVYSCQGVLQMQTVVLVTAESGRGQTDGFLKRASPQNIKIPTQRDVKMNGPDSPPHHDPSFLENKGWAAEFLTPRSTQQQLTL